MALPHNIRVRGFGLEPVAAEWRQPELGAMVC